MKMITRSPLVSPCIEALESRIAPARIFALDGANNLVSFESASPGTVTSVPITGLSGGAGETLEGIDFRPATGQLYALGIVDLGAEDEVRIYRVNPATGVATLGLANFATVFTVTDGTHYGFDFNPTDDTIRVVNDADENFRIYPDYGIRVDAPGNDTEISALSTITALAYDRNYLGGSSTSTTLYALDPVANTLVTIGGINQSPSASGGTIENSFALNLDFAVGAGFDIQGSNTAFASLRVGGQTALYTIDLATGAPSIVDEIGDGSIILTSLAIQGPQVTLVNAKTVTYLDVDGDLVTVKTTVGTFGREDFALGFVEAGGGSRGQLTQLILNDDGAEFKGAKITITAAKKPGGDGLVNVGWVNATGVDLGGLTIRGDLGKVLAGDSTTDTGPAIGLLDVRSIGQFGMFTQGVVSEGGLFTQASVISGPVKTFKIAGDLSAASVVVLGTVDSATIGGSIFEGTFRASGAVGSFKVGGDLVGGTGANTGAVLVQSAKSLIVGGSILGGSGQFAGSINGDSGIGVLKIGGYLRGDTGPSSGTVTVASGDVSAITVGRDLLGGSADQAGSIAIAGNVKSVTIGGSMIGGAGTDSGEISVLGDIGALKIGRDLVGGSASGSASVAYSGYIQAQGRIGSILVGGSILSGSDTSSGTVTSSGSIRAGDDIGSLTVKGSLLGNDNFNDAPSFVVISARGQATPGAVQDLAIGKITIGGRVEYAQILAGYNVSLTAVNGNASIGAVSVGRDWVASNLVAGVQDDTDPALDAAFGDSDDQIVAGFGTDTLVASIAKITIKGIVLGSTDLDDRFGFVAQHIGVFTSLGYKAPLTALTDTPLQLALITRDVSLREV